MKISGLIITILFFSSTAFPQGRGLITKFSIGETSFYGSAGLNKMSGDIGGDNFKSLLQNDLGYGLSFGARYTFRYNIGLRLFADYSKYRGRDKEQYNEYNGILRNNNFQTDVFGIGGQLEVILFGNSLAKDPIPHSVYLLAGVKKNYVNATVTYPYLNRDSTKSPKPFAHFFGIGYQYRFSNYLSFGVEAKQFYFHSDIVDGYYRNIPANKHDDTAFDVKLTVAYYIPDRNRLNSYNRRWE
ncbi:MAG: hypothetical protein H6Q19_1289 [Bacteroidetes bacterium]|nr:hypothetical protein [Bacteroidota bacterium]